MNDDAVSRVSETKYDIAERLSCADRNGSDAQFELKQDNNTTIQLYKVIRE